MANVSFSKNPEPVVESTTQVAGEAPVIDATPVSEIPTSTALAAPAAPQLPATSSPGAFDDDNVGFEDIILPTLNIVQGVGDLSQLYTPGELVWGGTQPLHTPEDVAKKKAGQPPLKVTVLGFRKRRYVEKTSGGAMGRLCSTTDEVAKFGGTLDYAEAKSQNKPLFGPLATALILVEKPEHIVDEDHTVFTHEFQGKWFALGLWNMKFTSYTAGAKVIFTQRKLGALKAGYCSRVWDVTAISKKFESNYAWVPSLKLGPIHTPEFRAFLADLLTNGN